MASFETRHAQGATLPLHRHRTAYAALVVDGEYLQFGPDGPVRCGPGSLLIHPHFHAHGNRFGAHGARVLNLELPASAPTQAFAAMQVADLASAREVFGGEAAGLPQLMRGTAPLPGAQGPDWQHAFVDALRSGDTPLGEIARRVGVSLEHAGRQIRLAYGLTPQALRRELRWRAALALLAGDQPLADVATAAGFADQSHLTRTTRLCSGLTPAGLRRQINCVQDRDPQRR